MELKVYIQMSEKDFHQLDLQYSLAYSNQSTEKNEDF